MSKENVEQSARREEELPEGSWKASFGEKRNAVWHWLAATCAFAALLNNACAQTVEGQPIAAQFGEYQVTDEGSGFSFAPNQCNVLGAGMNFPAFTTGVPVKVWDPQPGFTEVSTQVTAFVTGSYCAVSLGGLVHPHLASFYLTSGTGGLQEALNNIKLPVGFTNTIILNQEWYSLIQPRSAATVIASVQGNNSLGLVDITTNPYTSYSWNGTQYVVASNPGSGVTFPSSSGLLYSTGPTSSRIATSADVTGLINGATIDPANLNGTIYAAGVTGRGIGAAQSSWSGSATYPQCSAVTSGGNNYLAVSANSNVTPGTNSSVWWQVPNANTPTNGDCAFYIAASQVNGSSGTELVLPAGNTNTCIGFMEPTVTSPGNPNVVIQGAGKSASTLTQTCNIVSSGNAVLQQPDSSVPYALASIDWEDFAVNANHLAAAAVNVYGAQQFTIKHVRLENPADGSDHYIEFGHPSAGNHAGAWTYEMDLEDLDTVNSHGPGTGANITASVSGGVPAFTVVTGGSSYNAAYSQLILSGTGGNADTPCTNRGNDTISVTNGAISSITTTASGCSSPLYASVFGGNAVTYCFKFNDASDSKTIMALTPSECNTGVFNSNITSLMSFVKTHPIGTLIGISDSGNNNFWATQMDTVYRYGFDFEGATNTENVYGSLFERATALLPGSSDYHFGTVSNSPVNAPYAVNIFGDACGTTANFNGYNHFLPASGSVEASGGALPAFVHAFGSVSCDQTSSTANAANYIGQNFSLGNGSAGSVFNFGLGNGANGAINLTYPSNNGIYNWNYQNGTPATSGNNYSSPQVQIGGNYWNGSASAPSYVQLQTLFGSGSNPSQTAQFTIGGTPSSGAKSYAFDNPVTQANPGTFGTANYTSYLNSIVSGSAGSTGSCALNGGAWYQSITAAVFGCITAPAAGTGGRNTVGGIFTAFSQDSAANYYSEPVGVIGEGLCSVPGCSAYGANLIVGDATSNATAAAGNTTPVGQENDMQLFGPPANYFSGAGFRATLGFTNGNTGQYPFDALQVSSNARGASWRTGMTTFVGAIGANGSVINANALGDATSASGNYNCPTFAALYETYWTGSAEAHDQWDIQCVIGTGSTPNDYFQVKNQGGASGASHYFDLVGGILLELDGATSGSTYLSASATGGKLNLGSANATVDSSGNVVAASVSTGSTPPTACGSATGCIALGEGSTAGTPAAAQDYIRADAATHGLLYSANGGAETPLPGSAANTFKGPQTAPAFFPQTTSAGPYLNYWDDFLTGANNATNNIGSPTGASCSVNATYADLNHTGQVLLTSGTGGSGTGITCGTQSEAASFAAPNNATNTWTWETAVYVPVLPGTTAGAYQAGLSSGPNANPWTGGIQFYLSSANGTVNDWYCRYSTTTTDSTIAATAATWTRLTMSNDGTYLHWYINGSEATACRTAIAGTPSATQYPASWSAVALSATSVTMAVDYVTLQRKVTR